MTDVEKLELLKTMLEERNSDARALDDRQLKMFLDLEDGDVRRAAYRGALYKARCDGITTPDGMTMESTRSYWLTVAASYRVSRTGGMPRADEVRT